MNEENYQVKSQDKTGKYTDALLIWCEELEEYLKKEDNMPHAVRFAIEKRLTELNTTIENL